MPTWAPAASACCAWPRPRPGCPAASRSAPNATSTHRACTSWLHGRTCVDSSGAGTKRRLLQRGGLAPSGHRHCTRCRAGQSRPPAGTSRRRGGLGGTGRRPVAGGGHGWRAAMGGCRGPRGSRVAGRAAGTRRARGVTGHARRTRQPGSVSAMAEALLWRRLGGADEEIPAWLRKSPLRAGGSRSLVGGCAGVACDVLSFRNGTRAVVRGSGSPA